MTRDGRVPASAPFPGEGAFISGTLELRRGGSLPLDRYLAPVGVLVTGIVAVWCLLAHWRERLGSARKPLQALSAPEPAGISPKSSVV